MKQEDGTSNIGSHHRHGLRIVVHPTSAYVYERPRTPCRTGIERDPFIFVRVRNRSGLPNARRSIRRYRGVRSIPYKDVGTSGTRKKRKRSWNERGERGQPKRNRTTRSNVPLDPLPIIGVGQVNLQDMPQDPWPIPKSVTNPPRMKVLSRQYYHFRDNQVPMRPGDWEYDSEDEVDDDWVGEYVAGVSHVV